MSTMTILSAPRYHHRRNSRLRALASATFGAALVVAGLSFAAPAHAANEPVNI